MSIDADSQALSRYEARRGEAIQRIRCHPYVVFPMQPADTLIISRISFDYGLDNLITLVLPHCKLVLTMVRIVTSNYK
jgi:hypothetical protein